MEKRKPLEIKGAAAMVEWLRDEIGTGVLAGMLRRGDDIVHCPRVGEDGYVPLTDDERDHDGPAQVRPMSERQVASFIQLGYWCYKFEFVKRKASAAEAEAADADGYVTDKKKVPAMFPRDAARPAVDHPGMHPSLRRLRGVTHTPIPRADGTIITTPGYDSGTRLLYLPEPGLVVNPIPDVPSHEDVTKALKLLCWMVQDFQFLTVHDEANFLGMMLTPLLREIAPPPYKLGAVGAPQPGSGKSLLAKLLRIVHGGVFRSEVPSTDEELRKAITTILDVTTGPVVQIDNVSGVLRSSTLAGLLTSATWEDRRLGSNQQMTGRNDRLWVLTGNNLTLGGDLVRRTVWVTIDPGVPDPHLRTEFTVPDLERWAEANRGELLHSLLVLIRHWAVSGKPVQARGSDSYATWIETVTGILTEAGHDGVFDHRESARQEVGTDDTEWAEFLGAVHEQFDAGDWTVKDLIAKFQPTPVKDGWPGDPEMSLAVLPEALAEKASRSRDGAVFISRSLGKWLANRDGRWAGRMTVRRVGKGRDGVVWRIHVLPENGGHNE